LATDQVDRLGAAGLRLDLGPTRLPAGSATIAVNASLDTGNAISKRPGYRRFNLLAMAAPVLCFLEIDDKYVSVAAGDVDARD
jgi:hypothetical protein